ncbi:hypothetical protein OEG84_03675 [Hoeflea sp. G2-23]|uniref:Uncharacterized protein n=1 Tax=Hoeflea algicola TaxID=2983763 RepID=A0ABT3Z520_9HYPH|nr:hypothetical protein [Hoeflea algicola]MCY0146837.1 hypothetical protein [Hoeflea algicola]
MQELVIVLVLIENQDAKAGGIERATTHEALKVVEGKQRHSNALLQNRPEYQSLHLNCRNAHSHKVNVNSP